MAYDAIRMCIRDSNTKTGSLTYGRWPQKSTVFYPDSSAACPVSKQEIDLILHQMACKPYGSICFLKLPRELIKENKVSLYCKHVPAKRRVCLRSNN